MGNEKKQNREIMGKRVKGKNGIEQETGQYL